MSMSIAGWLPRDWAKAILPIAVFPNTNPVPVGTAFLVAHAIGTDEVSCLVTAKHVVFDENGQLKRGLTVLTNRVGGGGNVIRCDDFAGHGILWIASDSHDVAATVLPSDTTCDIAAFPCNLLEDFQNLREGDDIFFMGYPLYLGVLTGAVPITPIVRAGIIALRNLDRTFLIDANVFPGNSGSPVFFRPSPFQFNAENRLSFRNIRPPKLLGVVTSIVPYRDAAYSKQTGQLRVVFEENSGLASTISIEIVRELLNSNGFQTMVMDALERRRSMTTQQ